MLKPIEIDISKCPVELQPLLSSAKLYDNSCSTNARVIFIDKDSGYFLKTAPKDTLKRQAEMTKYFHSKGISANMLAYISDERDWLLTDKISGTDCTAEKYLEQPDRLCDMLAETLLMLHNMDFSDCPIMNHTELYLAKAEYNMRNYLYDKSHFPDSFGYKNQEDAWHVIETSACLLQADTLLHGDYCLPNIMLDNWRFAGFIDLDNGGVGDRHVDVFWGIWSLSFNLKTDRYRQRFIDAYGRSQVSEDVLRVVAAVEVFG